MGTVLVGSCFSLPTSMSTRRTRRASAPAGASAVAALRITEEKETGASVSFVLSRALENFVLDAGIQQTAAAL